MVVIWYLLYQRAQKLLSKIDKKLHDLVMSEIIRDLEILVGLQILIMDVVISHYH